MLNVFISFPLFLFIKLWFVKLFLCVIFLSFFLLTGDYCNTISNLKTSIVKKNSLRKCLSLKLAQSSLRLWYDLGSISPMLYEQLFHALIPKVQKDTDDLTVFLRFCDLCVLKLRQKMLVKSIPGVNFINILWAAFTIADHKFRKRLTILLSFFVLSGSARVKAVCITLMKFSPGAGSQNSNSSKGHALEYFFMASLTIWKCATF